MYKPQGFGTVTPYFLVEDPVVFVEFLTRAFNAKEVNRTKRDDVVINIQFQIGESMLFAGRAGGTFGAMSASYYLYVENADVAMQQAIDAGAELRMEVMDMPYGDRQGGVSDSFGNVWWVSQRLVEEDYL